MNINGKKIIKGSDDYNRLANQIGDMNLEIKLFLNKFAEFRKECKLVDKNLCKGLDSLVEKVDEFLEEDPTDLESNKRTQCWIDFEKEGILRVYVCDYCNMEIGTKWRDIKSHVRQLFHQEKLRTKMNVSEPKKCETHSSLKTNQEQNLTSTTNQAKTELKNNNNIKQQSLQVTKRDGLKRSEEKRDKRKADKIKQQNLPKKTKSFLSSNFTILLTQAVLEGNKMKQIPSYEIIEKCLIELTKPLFPNSEIKVRLFGSRINGLGSKHSDLDVFLDINDAFNKYKEPDTVIQNKLVVIQKALKESNVWFNIVAVKTARVPIIKVLHKETHLDCDIGFSNGLGFCNTQMMKYFFELQPVCHKICLLIKTWLTSTALRDQISTYTFILMTIFFLQTRNIVPPIRVLQENLATPAKIGPWQYNFSEKTLQELNIEKFPDDTLTCENLVCELFEFYANYRFDLFVISPYLGSSVEKCTFNLAKQKFPSYYFYFLQDSQNGFQLDRAMCVQDPIEQNHNVAKGVSQGLVKVLVQYFIMSATAMRNKLLKKS